MDRISLLREISEERGRQDVLKAEGRFEYTLADNPGLDDMEKLYCILEELAEAGKAIMRSRGLVTDGDGHALRKEIVQVAALALAWLEALPREDDGNTVGTS